MLFIRWQLLLIVLSLGLWTRRGYSAFQTGFDVESYVRTIADQYDTDNAVYYESLGMFIVIFYVLIQHRCGFYALHYHYKEGSDKAVQHYPWGFYVLPFLTAVTYATCYCAINLHCGVHTIPAIFGVLIYDWHHEVSIEETCDGYVF